MAMKPYINNFPILLIISLIQYSSSQIFITPLGGDMGTPTIISRQTITVQSNDGTPVTITKINIRPGRNINGGSNRLTPFDLMRLADSRMNEFFEAIISRQIQLFRAMEREEENREKENKEKEKEIENNKEDINKDNNQNENENKNNTIDDKEFELDENDENQKDNKYNKDNINEENKESKENVNNTISNKNKNKRKIGKLYVNEEVFKKGNKTNIEKKNRKRLTRKEIIFSRVCKYIFYSIILFTFYILIKKLLEILDIIDPEGSEKNVDINIKNNDNKIEETKEKIENEVIVNKERENKQN